MRTGIKHSTSDIAIFTDIDIPFGVYGVLKIIEELELGSDVVFIKRNESYFGHIPPTRKRISALAKWFNKTIFRLPFTDTQGGLKGFSQKGKTTLLDTKIKRYLFDIELAKKAHRDKNINLTQVEVSTATDFENVSTDYGRLVREIPSLFYLLFC